MQQLPEHKCGGFPELALPFLAGLVILRDEPQRLDCWAASLKCSETISTKVFSVASAVLACSAFILFLPGKAP